MENSQELSEKEIQKKSQEILDNNPLTEGKKTFEVKMRPAKGGGIEKAVFIGGELLDWQIDLNSFVEAIKMGPQYYRAIQKDIEMHFVSSVSEFLGRKVSADDIKKAIKSGYI